MSLDDKLRKILNTELSAVGETGWSHTDKEADGLLVHIKQAFYQAKHYYIPDNIKLLERPGADNLMTGQEWYDRFEKEYQNSSNGDDHEAYEAAKKAAGIK